MPAAPTRRDTSSRRLRISEMVREQGSVQVADLAEQFGVSMQTVRKDLRFLAQRGVMERAYGGGIASSAVSATAIEPAFEAKRGEHTEEKRRIGLRAASLVQPGESIVLDSGTTAIQMAESLPNIDITVVSNDFGVLAALAPKGNIRLLMLGGELRRKNMAFYGGQTVDALADLHVDRLFLGVDGFDLERGITTHYEPEAMLNRKMVEAASQVIAITDSSKFGRTCLHRIIQVSELDVLITDTDAPTAIRAASAELGFALHLA